MPRRNLLLVAVALAAMIAAMIHVGSPGGGPAPRSRDDSLEGGAKETLEAEDVGIETTLPTAVRGLVLDDATGRPLAGADVRFRVSGEFADITTTNDRGAWSHVLATESLEDASVRVSAPGYVPRNRVISVFAQPTLHEPMIVTRLESVVCVFSGVVVDPEGRPVAGALVYNGMSGSTRVTNARGEFRAIPWGRRMTYISVLAEGWPLWSERVDPDADPAREKRLRITLPAAVAGRGLVLDDLGQPVEGARVQDDNDEWTRETRTDALGRFTWPVTHFGCDWVYVEKAGYTQRIRDDYVVLHDRGEIRVVLDRNAVLAGRVESPDGGDLPLPLSVATGHDTVALGPDGMFRFPDHAPGEVSLTAGREAPFNSPRYYQQRLSFTGDDQDFVVAPAERREDLRLVIGPLDSTRCRILDALTGRPVVGAVADQGIAGADGEFDAVFPRRTDPKHRMVSVTADGYLPYRGPCEPEIRLMPWREVELRVLAPDGKPAAGFSLWPEIGHMSAWEIAVVTDISGRARCRVAASGPALVRHGDGRYPHSSKVIPTGVDHVEWRLEGHPVLVTILVTDEAGRPLPDVRVTAGPSGRTNFGDGRIGLPDRKSSCRVVAPGREERYVDPRDREGRDTQTVTLRRAAPVTGRVVDAEGRPMPDVSVYVRRGSRDVTDAGGRFRIGGIAAGEEVELQTWVDGWPEQKSPGVAGGPEVEIRLPSRGVIRVRIAEEHATGSPAFVVFGGSIDDMDEWIESGSEDALRFARHETGVLTLSVPAGTVHLWLRVPPGLPRHYLDLRVPPAGTVGLTYDFPVCRGLTGTVTDPAGRPLPDADIDLQPCRINVDTTDEAGRFRLDAGELDWDDPEVSVGPWSLIVDHSDYAPYLVEDVDFTRNPDLSIRLRAGGRLVGRLVPPPSRARIEVLGPFEDCCFFSDPDEDGSFEGYGLMPPGPLRLRVTPRGGKPVERTVVVPDGGKVSVVIELD